MSSNMQGESAAQRLNVRASYQISARMGGIIWGNLAWSFLMNGRFYYDKEIC